MIYEIELPYPISVNKIYKAVAFKVGKRVAARLHLTKDAERYTEKAIRAIQDSKVPKLTGAIAIEIHAYCPDKKQRDIDNIRKLLYDSCTKAGLWEDDSFIVHDPAYKYQDPDKEGRVILKVKRVKDGITKTKSGAWIENGGK